MPKMLVLGAGLIAVDHIFLQKGPTSKMEDMQYLGSAGGGSVGNTLTFLSLLGNPTQVFGIIGNDIASRIVRADFTRFNVDHSALVKRGTAPEIKRTRQFSHLIRQNGQASFTDRCMKCGGNLDRDFQMTRNDLSKDIKESAKRSRLTVLDRANSATLELARATIEGGGVVSYDVGYPSFGEARKASEELLHLATIVKADEKVLNRYTGKTGTEALEEWRAKFRSNRLLIATRGGKGILGYWQSRKFGFIFDQPAIPCESVRDTGGAGDVLNAIALHFFTQEPEPEDEREIEKGLRLAQALASLSTSTYGARGLQRALKTQGITKNQIMDIAQRIDSRNIAANSFPPTIGLPTPLSNPFRLSALRGCPVCGGAEGTGRKLVPKIRRGTKYYSILTQANSLMAHAFNLGLASRKRLERLLKSPTILVGSGGSLSAAVFGETIISKQLGIVAKAVAPFEFTNNNLIEKNVTVWLISHGGENPDILSAAINAKKLGLRNVVVLTASRSSSLHRLASSMDWPVVLIETQERGFVATSGLLSMISAFAGIYASESQDKELIDFFSPTSLPNIFSYAAREGAEVASRFPSDMSSQHIVALGSGWSWPAVVDFESKIVEGGVCTVEVSELKNFTHGRYINAFHHRENRHIVLMSTTDEIELARYLNKRLGKYFESISLIETHETGVKGSVDLILKSLYSVGKIAERIGVDIASPVYPPEARGLYGWKPRNK